MHSIIAYKNGSFRKIGDDEFSSLIRFGVIDFLDPSEVELKTFFDRIDFNVNNFYQTISRVDIPSILKKTDYLHIVFGVPITKDKQIGTTPLNIILYKGYLILIHRDKIEVLSRLLDEIQKDLSRIEKLNVSNIIYRILADINEYYMEIVDKLGDEIEIIEERIVKYPSQNDVKRVYSIKKALLFFKSVLRHNINVVNLVLRDEGLRIFIKDISNFNSLYTNINQVISVVELYRERLSEVMDIYEGALANRLNAVMKYFAAVASFLLWPTVVSGIYGMNFRYLPLADNYYGFYIMLLIMLLGIFIMLLLFKKRRWL